MPASESEVLVGRRYLERSFLDAAMRLFVRNAELVTAADWTQLAERLLERNRIPDAVRVCELGGVPLPRERMLAAADWLRPAVRSAAPYVPGEQPGPGRRVIKLNTNENPYPPSPRVLETLGREANATVRLYPDPEARALRTRAGEVYGVPADHILAGNGSDELLALLLRATIDPGERVAFPVPTYSLYGTPVAVQGGAPVRVPWPEDFPLPPALAA